MPLQPRPWQDPVAKLPPLDLDALLKQGQAQGADRAKLMQAAQEVGKEQGLSQFTYQGTSYDFTPEAFQSLQEPARPLTTLEQPQALKTSSEARNSLLESVDREMRVRTHDAWTRQFKGDGLAPDELRYVNAYAATDATGMRKAQRNLLDGLAGLPEENRTRISAGIQDWQAFQKDRIKTFAPELGEGFIAYSGEDRINALAGAMSGPNDPIKQQVWDGYIVPLLGPEAAGVWAQSRAAQQAAALANIAGRVGQSPDADSLGNAYAYLNGLGARNSTPETAPFVALLRLQVEKLAQESGVVYEPLTGIPRSDPKHASQGRRAFLENEIQALEAIPDEARTGRNSREILAERRTELDRLQASIEAPHIATLIRDTKKLVAEVSEARLGKEAAKAVVTAYEIESAAYQAGAEVFAKVNPDVFDKAGRVKDGLRVADLQTMLGAMAQDPSVVKKGSEFKVSLASGFFNALLYLDRKVGTQIAAHLDDQRPALYVLPDGAVFKDPIEMGYYIEKKWRADPEKYVWAEDPKLHGNQFLSQFEQGAALGQEYIKPTIIAFDAKGYAEQTSYAHGPIGGTKTIFEALHNRATASMAPDDKIGRAITGTAALAGDFILDPLNAISGGAASGAQSVARYRKTLEQMTKAGVTVSDAAKAAGVADPATLLARSTTKEAVEASKVAARSPVNLKLPDGTVLNPAYHGKYRTIVEMFGGGDAGESIAGKILVGMKDDPNFIAKQGSAVLQNPTFRKSIYEQMRRGGLVVADADQAATIFQEVLPVAGRIMADYSDLDAMAKMNRYWGAMFLGGDQAMSASIQKAKGFYVAGINPFEPFRAPAIKGKLGLDAALQPSIALVQQQKWYPSARQFAERGGDIARRYKSFIRRGTVPLIEAQGTGKVGVLNAPYELTQAMRRHSQTVSSAPAVVEDWMVRWTTAGQKTIPNVADEAWHDIPHALEAPSSSYPEVVRWLAFRDKVRRDLPSLNKVMAAANDEAEMGRALGEQMNAIAAKITDADIAKAAARFEPVKGQYLTLSATLERMGQERTMLGLGENIERYAPHMFIFPKNRSKLQQTFRSRGHTMLGEEGAASLRQTFSAFNLERTGPDNLVMAEILGLDYVRDPRVVMYERFDRHIRDMADANALRSVTMGLGREKPSSLGAVRAILDGTPLNTADDVEAHLTKLTARAKDMEKGYATVAAKLSAARKAQSKFEKKLGKAGIGLDKINDLPDGHEIRLLHHDLDQTREAVRQAAVEFGTAYELDMAEIARIAEHSSTGHTVWMRRKGQIMSRLKNKELMTSERQSLTAELNAVEDNLRIYRDATEHFESIGINARDRSAMVYQLYNRPSLYHLTPDEVVMLKDKMAKVGPTLKAVDDERGLFFDTIEEATEAYKANRKSNEFYAKWTDDESREITKLLSDTYLPVEIVLALKSYGFKIGKEVNKDAALYAGLYKMKPPIVGWLNKTWKSRVTVYNPSLHFGFRNQIDAFFKRINYSALQVFSPALKAEYNGWRSGTIKSFVDATGREVKRLPSWRDAMPLFQTFEQRADVVGAIMGQGQDVAAQGIGKRLNQAVAAGDPSSRRGLGMSMTATRGRAQRGIEKVFPFGPQAAEASDNSAKSWIYFVNRKNGMSHASAMQEAFDWGRDYSNLTKQELMVADFIPVAFYNFFKQNTKALLSMLKTGRPSRMAWWPKFKDSIEAEMPEELRPEWSNLMDSILTSDGVLVLPLDMSGLGFFDPLATMVNGFSKDRGIGEVMSAGGRQAVNSFLPAWQMAISPFIEGEDLGVQRRFRLPADVSKEVAKILSGSSDPAQMGGSHLGGSMTVHVTNGVASIEFSRKAEIALALSGMSVWATTGLRHWEAERHGGFWEWARTGAGITKRYPYKIVPEQRLRLADEEVRKQLETLWFFSENGEGGIAIKDSLPPDLYRAAQVLAAYPEIMDRLMTSLYQTMKPLRPGGGQPMPMNPNRN